MFPIIEVISRRRKCLWFLIYNPSSVIMPYYLVSFSWNFSTVISIITFSWQRYPVVYCWSILRYFLYNFSCEIGSRNSQIVPLKHVLAIEVNWPRTCTVSLCNSCRFTYLWCHCKFLVHFSLHYTEKPDCATRNWVWQTFMRMLSSIDRGCDSACDVHSSALDGNYGMRRINYCNNYRSVFRFKYRSHWRIITSHIPCDLRQVQGWSARVCSCIPPKSLLISKRYTPNVRSSEPPSKHIILSRIAMFMRQSTKKLGRVWSSPSHFFQISMKYDGSRSYLGHRSWCRIV